MQRRSRDDAYVRAGGEGMIRTDYTRQTAITNSTPPVGDNYRAGREATRWRTKMCVGWSVPKEEASRIVFKTDAAAPPFVNRAGRPLRRPLFNLLKPN